MPEPVRLPSFHVTGFAARTTNHAEMSGEAGKIGPLWARFMGGGAAEIPGVATEDPAVYSVYTGYESDENGAYDVILGKATDGVQSVAEGMRSMAIPAADYLVFTGMEPSPESIRAGWLSVYEYFLSSAKERRAYTVDFERYTGGEVSIYIAVLPRD